MSRRNSIILGLLFVLLVVEIVILAPKETGFTQHSDGLQKPSQVKPEASTGQVMENIYLIETKSDGREWELWAKKARARPGQGDDWVIEDVKVKFYGSQGVTYLVTGKLGNVVPNKKDMKIEGDVVTKSSNGYVYLTDSVVYNSEQRKLMSPNEIKLTGPKDNTGDQLKLTGSNLLADLATNEINIDRNVKAQKNVRDGKTAVIKSDRAKLSGRTHVADFSGNVKIQIEMMTVRGPKAQFRYQPDSGELESVFVDGGVQVADANKTATSQSVDVHFLDERVVFKGAPKVIQNGDELVGDEIVFLNGGRKVKVMNAKAKLESSTVEERR